MSIGLDQDQGRHSVGLYLGPNCLQRFSAESTSMERILNASVRILRLQNLNSGICLFDLIRYIPVNNLTVMSGRIFLG